VSGARRLVLGVMTQEREQISGGSGSHPGFRGLPFHGLAVALMSDDCCAVTLLAMLTAGVRPLQASGSSSCRCVACLLGLNILHTELLPSCLVLVAFY
jgi:hypothetical protein